MLTTRLTSLTQHDAWNEICCLCPFQSHALLLCIASPERAGRLLATSKPAIIQAGHNSQFIIIAASPGWNICVALPSHFPWREHQNKQGSFYLGGKKDVSKVWGTQQTSLLYGKCLWSGEVWFDLSALLTNK